MITTAFFARVLSGIALMAALVALLTMWALVRDPMKVAKAVQREGMYGVLVVAATDLWQRVVAR
jgi:hypothetical protein